MPPVSAANNSRENSTSETLLPEFIMRFQLQRVLTEKNTITFPFSIAQLFVDYRVLRDILFTYKTKSLLKVLILFLSNISRLHCMVIGCRCKNENSEKGLVLIERNWHIICNTWTSRGKLL